jgi:hypothetical protein
MYLNTETLLLCHDLNTKEKWDLFVQTVRFLRGSDAPVVALCDKTMKSRNYGTDKEYDPYLILKENLQCEIRENQPLGEWEKVKQAFDSSDKDFIAICHQDDWWKAHKMMIQLRVLRKYPTSPICMTAYDCVTYSTMPYGLSLSEYTIPVTSPFFGCINVMPSMWLLRKSLIKEWHIPFKAITAVDIASCMELCNLVPKVPVITLPLLHYNYHAQNTTHTTMRKPEWDTALQKCHKYTQDFLTPHFVYEQLDPLECFEESFEEKQMWLDEHERLRVRFEGHVEF